MKYYAVLDTNVLVSAMLKWDSVPGSVVSLAFDGLIVPVVNDEILREYREVLSRPKFHFPREIVDTVVGEIERQAVFVNGSRTQTVLPDPKDVVFYAVTMEERKTEDAYLVTGNLRHFPVVPFIVTPRRMLDIIIADAEGL